MHRNRLRSALTLVLALATVALWNRLTTGSAETALGPPTATSNDASNPLETAFDQRQSGVWVESAGTLVRHLPDDDDGSRHQRFILRLDNDQTILVSHNIDLAPRLGGVGPGETVAFRGRYEWNEQGGVVHWTHHDPDGRQTGGWLEAAGKRTR
ncbi:MAG: DUF3465 domain-containing protein [Longimicrobiales bacterium]